MCSLVPSCNWLEESTPRGGYDNSAKKVAGRLVAGRKRYQPIVAAAKARDVGEFAIVAIIKGMLADVFG